MDADKRKQLRMYGLTAAGQVRNAEHEEFNQKKRRTVAPQAEVFLGEQGLREKPPEELVAIDQQRRREMAEEHVRRIEEEHEEQLRALQEKLHVKTARLVKMHTDAEQPPPRSGAPDEAEGGSQVGGSSDRENESASSSSSAGFSSSSAGGSSAAGDEGADGEGTGAARGQGGEKGPILPFTGEISYRCFTGCQKYS